MDVWFLSCDSDGILTMLDLRSRKTWVQPPTSNFLYQILKKKKKSVKKIIRNRNRLADMEKKFVVTKGEEGGEGIN